MYRSVLGQKKLGFQLSALLTWNHHTDLGQTIGKALYQWQAKIVGNGESRAMLSWSTVLRGTWLMVGGSVNHASWIQHLQLLECAAIQREQEIVGPVQNAEILQMTDFKAGESIVVCNQNLQIGQCA